MVVGRSDGHGSSPEEGEPAGGQQDGEDARIVLEPARVALDLVIDGAVRVMRALGMAPGACTSAELLHTDTVPLDALRALRRRQR